MSTYFFSQLVRNVSFFSVTGAGLLASFLSVASTGGVASAQATPPITPSGLHTQVNISAAPTPEMVQYDIMGGTRPGAGENLFHSFGEFGLPTNNIANFLNGVSFDLNGTPLAAGLPTSNILGRVTGGNVSNILGAIQTVGFENANLFLMNPAGFLFGPNATVNVGGMVTFTSADYLKLTDSARFNAIPNAAADLLLTASPVAAFGFLGTSLGAITVQGTQFMVTQATGISLVGGNITIQSGTLDDGTVQPAKLTAPGGEIDLAGVASPGEILSSSFQFGANVNGESFTSLGSITISQNARIDTAEAAGGTIAIRGGQLTITDGATIASTANSNPSAPAGSVTISGTDIQMTGSDVVINGTNVSATGSKVTATNLDGSGGTITITAGSGDNPGNVTVAQDALLDASGTRGGSISIQAKQLVLDNATISADTATVKGAPTAIDIDLTGDLMISDSRGLSAITARTTSRGDAGEVRIASTNFEAASSAESLFLPIDTHFALIDTHTSGSGKAGNVSIETTGNLNVTGQPTGPLFFIDSGTVGLDGGHGGDVMMSAENIRLENANINSGDNVAVNSLQHAAGSGGKVTITTDTLSMTRSVIATNGFFAGRAGDLTINARDIEMITSSGLALLEFEGGGKLTITANRLIANSAQFDSETFSGPGGGFTITANVVELKNGTTFRSQTVGEGDAGDIRITATERLTLEDRFDPNDLTTFGTFVRPTGIFTNSLGGGGNSGSIIIITPQLEITGGARINSTTQSSGLGGDVVITARDQITISGERQTEVIEEGLFGLGSTRASGIYTRTVGNEFCTGACGDGGHVSITTGSLDLSSGAVINSGTTSTGHGGDVTLYATDTISISGTMADGTLGGSFSQTVGTEPVSGAGGNITLTAGQSVVVSDGASVSASSTGPGNAGNIVINAGQTFTATNINDAVTTEAKASSGGNITLIAIDTVQLTDSRINASVADGSGKGGNISIDPQYVILQGSQILAQAADGQGGAITITTNLFLPDAFSLQHVNADSGSGVNGTVTIQSPNSPASGKIQPLSNQPLEATSLLNQRCAALDGGQFSSFTVAGRDILPTEPDSWLASPLAMLSTNAGQRVRSEENMSVSRGGNPILSLRQVAPAGFLTQAFAADWSAACQS
ncbi:MAG: filamentous hemagglutinin N-terminal domain-containing protein [Nitrospirales bacterium]